LSATVAATRDRGRWRWRLGRRGRRKDRRATPEMNERHKNIEVKVAR